MKLLILSDTLWPYGSGGELATYLYTFLLSMNGISVTVCVTNRRALSSFHNIPFKLTYCRFVGTARHLLYADFNKLDKLVKESDVVYLASSFWWLIPFVKRLRKPVVVHLHSYDPVCPVGSLFNFITWSTCYPDMRRCSHCIWLYEISHGRGLKRSLASTLLNAIFSLSLAKKLHYADALIFVSKAQRRLFLTHLRKILGDVVPPTYVIQNPIPSIDYVPLNSINVGYFGGASPLKGFHILLNAWIKVFKRHRGVKLFATKMGKLASSNVLRRANVIAYNRLSFAELHKLYADVGVVAVPSIWQEPSSYAVVEALLCGRLVVASNIGGIPELFGDAPGVKLVPPGDANALADALDLTFSMDREDAVELSLKNREYTLRKFDNGRSLRELVGVLERALSSV